METFVALFILLPIIAVAIGGTIATIGVVFMLLKALVQVWSGH